MFIPDLKSSRYNRVDERSESKHALENLAMMQHRRALPSAGWLFGKLLGIIQKQCMLVKSQELRM